MALRRKKFTKDEVEEPKKIGRPKAFPAYQNEPTPPEIPQYQPTQPAKMQQDPVELANEVLELAFQQQDPELFIELFSTSFALLVRRSVK